MERLGDDDLSSIINKIGKLRDRISFSQVSKQFMRVGCIRLISLHNSLPGFLYEILPTSTNMKNFCCSKPLSNSHMKLLAQSCPKLFKLDLGSDPSEFDFDDDGLCAVVNACSQLKYVDISKRIHLGDVGIHSLMRSCKNLRFLYLGGCVSITDESLKAIGESSNLNFLNLRGCYLITDLGLKYLAKGNVKNCLVELDLGECDRITYNGIIYLNRIVTLKCLFLLKCHNFSWKDVKSVALKCQQLEYRTLSSTIKKSMPDHYVYEIGSCRIDWE